VLRTGSTRSLFRDRHKGNGLDEKPRKLGKAPGIKFKQLLQWSGKHGFFFFVKAPMNDSYTRDIGVWNLLKKQRRTTKDFPQSPPGY